MRPPDAQILAATLMITAQALCGAAGAVIVPSLVALIAENYTGTQQATALGVARRVGSRHGTGPGNQTHSGDGSASHSCGNYCGESQSRTWE